MAELDQQSLQIDTKDQQIKQMEASLKQDQSRYDTSVQNVKYCTVYAPKAETPDDPPRWFISALLTNIAPGYLVQSGTSGFSAGTTIMTLSDLSHIFVLASVDESDYEDLKDPEVTGIKQRVRITADSFQGQAFEGEVVRVATKGVNTNNVVTFEVKIEVTSANRTLLRPEMTSTAKIVCDSRNDVLAIPASMRRTGNRTSRHQFGQALRRCFLRTSQPHPPPKRPASRSRRSSTTTGPSTRRGGRGGGGGGVDAVRPTPPTTAASLPPPSSPCSPPPARSSKSNTIHRNSWAPITVGPSSGDLYEVISGLNEGETVVVKQNGQESRFRNPNASRCHAASLGGGGGGGGR